MSKTIDPTNCKRNRDINAIANPDNVMESVAEAKTRATYVNTQQALSIQIGLIEINIPQPPTQIQVENSTAVGIDNNKIKKNLNQYIGVSIGYRTTHNKENPKYTGGQKKLTSDTTIQNTLYLRTI